MGTPTIMDMATLMAAMVTPTVQCMAMAEPLALLRLLQLASPALPTTCAEAWRRIGLDGSPTDQRLPAAARWGGYPGGLTVTKGAPLFPRLAAG